MTLRHQFLYTLPTIFLFAFLCEAGLAAVIGDNSISSLYENLLQREYPGSVVFPNHQVERKAQRSQPSLRLRFGRRNDPELMPTAEKRWFGDVRQKPIRSPSLRLRFGRRSDPSMPLHSSFDVLMNNLAAGNVGRFDDNALEQDYDGTAVTEGDVGVYEPGYERNVRKPLRLRWGRSVPAEWQVANENTIGGYDDDIIDNDQQFERADEILGSLMSSEKFRNMLLKLRQYDDVEPAALSADEFSREARRPGSLRLRWGRSTGGSPHTVKSGNDEVVRAEKKSTPNVNAAATQNSSAQSKTESKN